MSRRPLPPVLAILGALAAALFAAGCGPKDPGARVFSRKCAACHGREGKGDTRFAKGRPYTNLTDGLWRHGGDVESIRKLILDGDPKSPMPPYRDRLSPDEIDAVTRHVSRLGTAARVPPVPEVR